MSNETPKDELIGGSTGKQGESSPIGRKFKELVDQYRRENHTSSVPLNVQTQLWEEAGLVPLKRTDTDISQSAAPKAFGLHEDPLFSG